MGERLVVIGADAAGMTAASQARRRDRSLEVIAFEKGPFASYAACGEPYYVSGDVDTLDDLIARTPEQFAKAGIDLRLHSEVMSIDLERRSVSVHNHEDGATSETGFDQLLIATGARAFIPPMPGIDLDGVHTLRTLDDAHALRILAEGEPGNIVIVGGGYIGVEVAEAFDVRGWTVTMVEALPTIMARTLDEDFGAIIAEAMEKNDVNVVLGEMVERIEGDRHVTAVITSSETIPADIVVLAVGGRPVSELAGEAGITLGASGAIVVDDHQRTSVDGIWSAGDCADVYHRVTGTMVNLHLGTVANKTGRIAGINITGGDASFPGALGTAITRFHDLEIAVTGARLIDAESAGIDAVDVTVHGLTAAHYMPEASDLSIRLTVERGTARALGAQIAGGSGAGKRIDVFATAIWESMTADQLEWVDFAYAPPFAPVWDLMAIAARKASAAAVATR
ncbi:MAG: FAD-dependent oxidoreductase [Actinomycetia bacterium]|nr:FAD-dependent oxidoreductase [Actinomycetes bacterium]